VKRFAKQMDVPYPLLIDTDNSASQLYNVNSIPVTVALDKQGRAAGLMPAGYSEEQFAQIEALTGQLLKE